MDKIEERLVKHTFTKEELLNLGEELSRSLGAQRGAESEFEAVKSQFKARIAEAESKVEMLSQSISDKFCMRTKRCKVVMLPKERKKQYYAEIRDGVFEANPVLIEPMTQDDYQAELFEAESRFERRAEIQLFKDAILVLGRLSGKWYAALRVTIGQQKIAERLDPTGKKFKDRKSAFSQSIVRLNEWIVSQFGEETEKGFRDNIAKVAKIQETLEE